MVKHYGDADVIAGNIQMFRVLHYDLEEQRVAGVFIMKE